MYIDFKHTRLFCVCSFIVFIEQPVTLNLQARNINQYDHNRSWHQP